MYKMYVDGIVWEIRFPCIFFRSDHTNMVLAPYHKGNERKIGSKTVSRNHVNKNIEKLQKTLFKYREGGRTVGSGRVATIIE